ncbi:hypothetical protein NliqN6_3185 [Naganishia liquefaciens]|uniref:Uncharacterized protein n=1 Tax=Naganishia liquefaciens TaxID=104408 RepID=A0A8H3YF02_9TREE|nr:hypothetical protein NliqN6_3185 [Naganishia liquefaciens]
MVSHSTVQGVAPIRSKRPSVGPEENDGLPVGPPSIVEGRYARKKARLSDETVAAAQFHHHEPSPTSPISPVSFTANAATQTLFGSSPLTEPENEFPDVAPGCNDGDKCVEEVMSSQLSERQDVVLNRPQEPFAIHGEKSAQGSSLPSLKPEYTENRVNGDERAVDGEIAGVDNQTVQPVISTTAVTDVSEKDDSTGEEQLKAVDAIEPKLHTAHIPLSDKSVDVQVFHEKQEPKMEGAPEESVDDEFDDDPWFDEACLKSFNAIDASVQQFTTPAEPQPRSIPTARKSPPLLSLPIAPTENKQFPSFSQDFVDTRKAEDIDEKEIPVSVGFSTGRGKKVTVPMTAAAAQNARTAKLMQELIDIQNDVISVDQPSTLSNGKFGGDEAFIEKTQLHLQEQIGHAFTATPTRNQPFASAFTTAAGSRLAAVSDAARNAIDCFFRTEPDSATDGAIRDRRIPSPGPSQTRSQTRSQKASLFTTVAGSALGTPSANAQQITADFFNGSYQNSSRPTDYAVRPAHSAVMSLAIPMNHLETPTKPVARSIPPPVQATALDLSQRSTLQPTSLQDISNLQPSSPAREHSVSAFKTPLPAKMARRASQARAFQTPLLSHRQTLMSSTPTHSPGTALSPALPRRVGLGMTPRSLSGLRERPKFVSPFRTAVPGKENENAESPNMETRPGIRAIFSASSLKQPKLPESDVAQPRPCFQLTCPTERISLKKAGLQPGAYTPSALAAAGIPSEIAVINPVTAQYYRFSHLDLMKGPKDVMDDFRLEGLGHTGVDWFENHWRLVVWKLASLVRAKPQLLSEKWSYCEIVRQLKYRYEREVNMAHRSAIKRIQEQDSPPSLPMVLCVSAIVSSPGKGNADNISQDQKSLELTDGWYVIRANVDGPISRAVHSGKIAVGFKIAVSGAKLDADREGTHVLEAVNKSSLRITGNSTCLMPWDSRLGFTHKPFISALRSLSPDGGNIPLLDIRISKVFPLAYISSEKGKGTSPWSSEEEYKLQDEWNERYMQERSRLQAESERRTHGFEEDVEILRSAMEGLEGDADASACENHELERFRNSPTKSRFLRNLPGKAVISLFLKAQEELQSEISKAQAEVEDSIGRLCPPRSTRSFQIIRIADAGPLRHPHLREAQLQVWDAKQMGDKFLQEGARYQVSNLVPAQQKAWVKLRDKGEIYLSTSKGTTWKRCPE